MNDRTAMIVTVVGSSVGMGALLLTVMTVPNRVRQHANQRSTGHREARGSMTCRTP